MAARKPIKQKDLKLAKHRSYSEGYDSGFALGKQHGFAAGNEQGRTDTLKNLKHDRMRILMDALTKTSQAVDSIAHLACAVAKESL